MSSAATLSAKNFKGQTFSHELAPVTVFSGRNWKGKSARLEALSLALLGYVPGYSKRASDLFALFASGSEMSVGLGAATRIWREERGTIKYTGPQINEDAAVMLDPSVYFDLSGPARNRYLFRASGAAAKLSGDKLAAMIRANLKNIKLADNSQASELAIDAISSIIKPATEDVQEWLEQLAERARERKKQTAQNAKRMVQTLQGLVSAQSSEAIPQNTEAKLAEAQMKLKELGERSASLGALLNQTREQYRQLSAKAELLTGAEERDKLEAALLQERAQLNSESAPVSPDDKVNTTNEKLATLDALKQSLRDLEARLLIVENENVTFERTSAENLWANLQKLDAELAELQTRCNCSLCGQQLSAENKAAAIKALQERIANTRKEEKSFSDRIVIWEKEHKKKLKSAKGKISDATKAIAKAQAEYNSASVISEEAKAQQQRYAEKLAQLVTINAKLETIAKKRECHSDAQAAATALPALRETGEKLAAEKEALGSKIMQATEAVAVAEADHKRLLAHKAQLATRERAKQQADQCEIEAEVAKQFSAMLDALQAKLVEDAIKPLVEKVNELCKPLLPASVTFLDGELVIGGHSHKTASDSEKMLIYAGLCLALASSAPVRLAAIGRLEAFDYLQKPKLIKLVCDLVNSGKIDGAVLVNVQSHSSEQFEELDNLKVIIV